MPNIKPTLGYIRKMRLQESRYIADVNAARVDFRKAALDIISRYGVSRASIQDVKRELYTLEQRAMTAGRDNSAMIDDVIIWYANQQLGALRKVGESGLPTVQQLNLDTYQQRQEIYAGTIQAPPAWTANLARSLETNMVRLAATDATLETVVGRLFSNKIVDGRASVFRVSGAAAVTEIKTTAWTAAGALMAGMFFRTSQITGKQYEHQAVAAIDENTTDCCLRVHGQIQPLDKPFHLVGTPRFADEMDTSPFHWNCRTAISLYTKSMEMIGVSTQEMVDAAKAERRAREEKSKNVTFPVSSTSRR